MTIFVHLLLFMLSTAVIWFFAGLLIESVTRVARRFHQSGFTVAFFVLGFLTSISEVSVMVNSTINKTPQVSAGNLAGASFVILLCIVPLVAILGKGIQLKNTLHSRNLVIALVVVAMPTLLMLDGNVSRSEGALCFLIYGTLAYFIRKHDAVGVPKVIAEVEGELMDASKTTPGDIAKILLGALFIFIAGHLLVEEAVYFSAILSIPASIVGLLVLSLGTNIPELVIAIRSILKKRKDVAFGDYLGSAVTNTLIFAFLPWLNGGFAVEPTEFIVTAALMTIGFIAFYLFARSKNTITMYEGMALVSLYGVFMVVQVMNFIRFATD